MEESKTTSKNEKQEQEKKGKTLDEFLYELDVEAIPDK